MSVPGLGALAVLLPAVLVAAGGSRVAPAAVTSVTTASDSLGASPSCLVSAHPLARGTTLRAADIALAPPAACRTPSPPAASLGGRVTRRVIAAGEPLRPPAIEAPPLVSAGEPVDFVWSSGSVRITLRGTAVASAARGERVWVRFGARRRLQGTVAARGLVEGIVERTDRPTDP